MKKIATLLSICVMLSLAAFGAGPAGQWKNTNTSNTQPQNLTITVSGTTLSGAMDGLNLTNTGTSGAFFWFHVVRSGVDYLYKGQLKGSNMQLSEVSSQSNRVLTFTPAP